MPMNAPVIASRRKLGRQLLALAVPVLAAPAAWSQFAQTAAGTYDYNNTANWTGGVINGSWDSGLTLTGSQTVTFGADTPLSTGLSFAYDGAFNVTFTGTGGARTITLGGDISVNTAAASRTITFGSTTSSQNLNVDLGGVTRAFTVGSGRTLAFTNVISNGGLNLAGGTINFSGVNTYSGATTITSGSISLNGSAGSAAQSDFTVRANTAAATTLSFASNSTGTGTTRAKSVTLDGSNAVSASTATLSVAGNSSNNNSETIGGALGVSAGFGIVSVSPNSARNTRLTADSLSLGRGAAVLFRGTNLGVNSFASATANSANIVFNNAPALVGGSGGAGTSTVKIVAGAYGDISSSGTGTGLVTYDATYGVRLLNTATEYASTITDGQSQLDNIRVVGATGANTSVTVNSPTTINSLSLVQGGTAGTGAGVNVTGTGTLTVSSGVIFNPFSSLYSASIDAVAVSTAGLDLNNQHAYVLVGGSSNINNSNLSITSAITNAQSLTKSGNGALKLGGTAANTYSGDTYMAGGSLELGKTAGVNAIGGNLVVNAGSIYLTNANQIGDTKDITVNGGNMNFRNQANTSSRNETFRNLTMTGGSVNAGANASGNTVTMENATLTGGAMTLAKKNNVVVNNALAISGGATISVDQYSTTSSADVTSLGVGAGGLSITQNSSGAYTPISLTGGTASGVNGGKLVLNGDLTVTGNGSNANTTTIAATAASTGGNEATISLEGVRTFDIGNGAAAVDLAIAPVLANGAVTGGLVKAGAGTLQLSGVNTYTGATAVNAGTLLLGASNRIADASNLVLGGGTLATGGFNETLGTLTVGADSVIDFGAGASALLFADSSALSWGGSVSLSLVNFTDGLDSIRFGTSSDGLTAFQLGRITINGMAAAIDANGFLSASAIPEPSAFAGLAGAAGLLAACVRRRRLPV